MKVIFAPLLIDGIGDTPIVDAAIHIGNGRIEYVGPARDAPLVPDSAEIHDLAGHTVLPGLIDAHVHCTGLWNPRSSNARHQTSGPLAGEVTSAPAHRGDAFRGAGTGAGETLDGGALLHALAPLQKMLDSGVTSIRDLGAPGSTPYDLRAAVNDGLVAGPRMIVSGPIIRPTGGHGHRDSIDADSVDGVRHAVRTNFHNGADLIKVTASGGGGTAGTNMGRPTFSVPELRCAVDEALQRGSYVTAHCHSLEGMIRCLDAGIPMIEHGTFMNAASRVEFDADVARRIVDLGVVVSPTVAVFGRLLDNAAETTESTDPDVRRYWKYHREGFQRRLEVVGRLHEFGVTLIIGSDAPCRGVAFDDFAYSVELHVRAGVSPMDAIKSATSVSARALGLDRVVGSLTTGLDADIIAVSGDPTDRITDLANVRFVMQQGTVVRDDVTPLDKKG